ncbi:hypothetical protein AFL01nite_08790 [Aeromicrobium flavum]|uniref:Integral membrane protein n=1 Tax=Aeromicrobium flavum TaxID=416568 RepID=A0A512HSW4_9ACTN|nr:hypothetical protein [Aeromicrobium flavum]GEO88552.1 hypothetical protein AFL01nite_08790 [Aeromicrobium flavum]
MRRLRTPASRAAALVCLTIGALLVQRMIASTSPTYALLEGVLAVVAVLTAAKMWFHNCFESHLAALLLAPATAGGALLALTAGLPGGGVAGPMVVHISFLVLCAAIPVLLWGDARVRAEHMRHTRRPYAR